MLNFERIELLGFKSFADKVKIDLLDGITAIVGPNGCGKSNVADAIKWVLGEQSAKTLRGTSMQDVIFNGTQSRKSLSYCEVSLYFNNYDKLFPSLEYSEVVMTRKLFRNGDSEYYINRQPCRMKDIVDALHECGVSKDGYTIIGQGKVSEILSSKPEDRRAIFEEAVGIAKTKRDRKESINKLSRTNDNIVRVSDILTERERQLEPLKKQAEKTRAHRALSEDLKIQEVNAYIYKYDNASDTKNKINDRIKGYEEEINARNNELDETIKKYNEHQYEIKNADEKIRILNEKITSTAVGIESKSGETKLFTQQISFFLSENERLNNQNAENSDKTIKLKDDFSLKTEQIIKNNKEIDDLTIKSTKISKTIASLSEEIDKGEDLEQDVQSEVLKSVEEIADIKKNLASLSSEQNVISQNQKDVVDKVNLLVDKYSVMNNQLEVDKNTFKEYQNVILKTNEDIKDKSNNVSSTNEFIAKIDNDIYHLKNKLLQDETSLKFHVSLKESFVGFNQSAKNLLLASKNDTQLKSKFIDVVASIIHTNKDYETAIQTAIGNQMQNVITKDTSDAEYIINYLKRTNGGRITCLPISSVKPRFNSGDINLAVKEKGVLGLATNLVDYDSKFENVILFLLGGTLIVDNLQNANFIAKKYRYSFKIVTLDGDVVSTAGTLTGGSRKTNDVNLLATDRLILEFTEKVNNEKVELARLEESKKLLISQVNLEVDELEELRKILQETKQKSILLEQNINHNETIINELKVEIEKYNDQIALINTRLEQIKTEFSGFEKGDEALTKRKETASKERIQNREKYLSLRKERDEILKENAFIQSRLSNLRAEISFIESEKDRINNEIAQLGDLTEKNLKNISSNEQIIKELKLKMEKVALSSEEQQALKALRDELNEIDLQKEKLNELLIQDNLKRDVLQADINKSIERRNTETNNLTKVDTELQFMSENIEREYNLNYDTCQIYKLDNFDISMSNQDISSLKRKISLLGNINPNAIEEYNELSESYNELLTQRDDLVKAQEDLQKVIDDLTKEMTLTFNEGFKTIKSNFTKIFKELFGGGTADLIVEESLTDDPLDAGIEIVAEPPGKKLQKISLLSGGEMSLTAIAILFAILKLRPMPFCVLDEIEAALDDANVQRFADYLKKFSKETQFICITHKKVTMENADGLFGVTMPEKGVSSIVSVKLADVKDIEDFKN